MSGWGVPPLDRAAKTKILAENYAAMHGIDLKARMQGIEDDEIDQWRAQFSESPAPYSQTTLADLVY